MKVERGELTPDDFMAELVCDRYTYTKVKVGAVVADWCPTCARIIRSSSPCLLGLSTGRAALADGGRDG